MKNKMRKAKGFSLVEITIAICLIGLLATSIIALSGDKELANLYKAESCINGINGKIKNFMNAALTSKRLLITDASNNVIGVFPDYYSIEFQKNPDKIIFKYEKSDGSTGTYDTITLSGYCRDNIFLALTGTLPFSEVRMNRGFQQIKANDPRSFALITGTENLYTGAIQVNLC